MAGEDSVDLVLISGDFQAIRNVNDLQAMSCPEKYRRLGDFHRYFDGTRTAPLPTIFIGGNHESSEYMLELMHGGWVCKNIYFLGQTGIVNFRGLRIAGISGIYNQRDYPHRHWEKIPLHGQDIKTVYHYRYEDILLLSLLDHSPDVFLSHDWPSQIWDYGNRDVLLQRKPFFKDDVNSGKLGSPPLQYLLARLSPRYWFSAHLHVCFHATVPHQTGRTTEFLALDKCMNHRKFLEIISIPCVTEESDFFIESDWIRKKRAFLRCAAEIVSTSPEFLHRFQQLLELEPAASNLSVTEGDPIAVNQTIARAFCAEISQDQNPEEIDI